jgi:flagellar basal-body rod modification protein FlgD
MSVSAISSTQAPGTPTAAQLAQINAANGAVGGETTLGENDFLQLLTTQLQNQDPLQPMSDTDFIAQMATFSQLSAQNTLNTDFSNYSQVQEITNAQSYIGQNVTVSGAAEGLASATGTVTGVTVTNGAPELTINGANYALSDITAIQSASAAAAASANSATSSTAPTTSSPATTTAPVTTASTSTSTAPATATSTAPDTSTSTAPTVPAASAPATATTN